MKMERKSTTTPATDWKQVLQQLSFDVELLQTVLAALSAAFFIASSYIQVLLDGRLLAINVIDLVFSSLFIVFFIIDLILSTEDDKWRFLYSPLAILDYVTVLPAISITIASMTELDSNVAQLYSVVALLRVLRLLRLIP